NPGAAVVQLFDDQAGVQDAQAQAAKLFWHAEIDQSGGMRLLAYVARKNFLVVVFAGARNDLLLGELVRQSLKLALFFGKFEPEHLISSFWRPPGCSAHRNSC